MQAISRLKMLILQKGLLIEFARACMCTAKDNFVSLVARLGLWKHPSFFSYITLATHVTNKRLTVVDMI